MLALTPAVQVQFISPSTLIVLEKEDIDNERSGEKSAKDSESSVPCIAFHTLSDETDHHGGWKNKVGDYQTHPR